MDMPKRNRKTQDSRNLQEAASDDSQEKIEYEWVVEKKSEKEMAVSINFKNPYDISA
jgi:dsRNA-specific ribonuclease